MSVVLCEVGLIAWLRLSGSWMDVTGSFWLRGVVPVELIVVALQTAALRRIYRSAPLRFGLIYGGTFALLHGLVLNVFGNPPADLARYLLADIGATVLLFGGGWLLFWRRS